MLFPELERYLAPQERFEALRRQALARFAHKLIDLSYANPSEGPDSPVKDGIRKALATDRGLDLQYTPYGGSTITRRIVADTLSQTHAAAFHWRDVVLTPGAMAALNLVFRRLKAVRPDGEVIVVSPCWLDYPLYLTHLGLRPRFVPVQRSTLHLDLDALSAALNERTCAVVLSQPANPTGTLYDADELRSLATLLQAHPTPPLLVSDECHREVLYDDGTFVSPQQVYDNTCIVYSYGKSLFIQGQRIGYVAASPRMRERDAFTVDMERLCRIMGFCTPTSLMQLALRHLVDVKPDIRRLAAKRDKVVAALRSIGQPITSPSATFFVYPPSPLADSTELASRLADRGVLVLPSEVFHHQGYIRLSLTVDEAVLDSALATLCEVYTHSVQEAAHVQS